MAATSSLLLASGSRRWPATATLPPSPWPQQQRLVFCLAARTRPLDSKRGSWRRSSSATGGRSTAVSSSSERWVLDPAGDGDWRHIGYKVARPGAIEIVSEDTAVTVGRVADKADIVLPVATVSGAHARLEKKGGSLLVTDLDSTNGTYINERRLNPGFPASVDPGSLLIFGDIHLAMFRVRKTVVVEAPSSSTEEAEGAQQETTSAEDI